LAALLFCLPPLTWIATGLVAAWLAARRGKSWRRGFALGFCFSTAGVVLAALPARRSRPRGLHGGMAVPTDATR
jgi:NhaP-type Na+/H+ or K+/H+ antiporter